jgi:predicted RNase H-like nuclease (RuvC/YqgF family)
VAFEEVAKNPSVRSEMVGQAQVRRSASRQNVSDDVRFCSTVDSLEYDQLSEIVAEQKGIIASQQSQIQGLRSRSFAPSDEIEEIKSSLTKAEGERQFLEQQLTEIRDSLHYRDFLKVLSAKLNRRGEELERELDLATSGEDRSDIQTQLNALHGQQVIAQREISIVDIPVSELSIKPSLSVSAMVDGMDLSAISVEVLNDNIRRLEEEREALNRQLDEERHSYVQKLKDARLSRITDYENVIAQLQKQCDQQRPHVESLGQKLPRRKS